MKKHLVYLLILSLLASFIAGCGAPTEEASGTVPWGAPAKFEGAGVGMPKMNDQD